MTVQTHHEGTGSAAPAATGADEPHAETPPQAEQRNPDPIEVQALLRTLSVQQARIAELQRQVLEMKNETKEGKPKDSLSNQMTYFVQKFSGNFPHFNAHRSQKDVTY